MRLRFRALQALAISFSALLAGAGFGPAKAQFTTLRDFCSLYSCHDGSEPSGPLLRNPATGDLFGVTGFGGSAGFGVAYRLFQVNANKWRMERLHSFCAKTNCSDGAGPVGNLIMDTAGDLYGVTRSTGGDKSGPGLIYELKLANGKYRFEILHTFTGKPDAGSPVAGLTYAGAAAGMLYDGASPLFGTTASGGSQNLGTIYTLTKSGKLWNETVLYSFCSSKDCADGANPGATLLMDAAGNLYGTTFAGGIEKVNGGSGVAFELSDPGTPSQKLTLLHTFCSQQPDCADGEYVGSGASNPLVMDASGNLYGTTPGGGGIKKGCCGVLFKIGANRSPLSYTVVYNFCSKSNCLDGANPFGALVIDSDGTIFGTTASGGGNNVVSANGGGTVFRFSGSTLDTLYAFCAVGSCLDGLLPEQGVTSDGATALYGTTLFGGTNLVASEGAGTLFEIAK